MLYQVEYNYDSSAMSSKNDNQLLPFPLLEYRNRDYIIAVESNLPFLEGRGGTEIYPFIYDIKTINSNKKYSGIDKLKMTYYVDSARINNLPVDWILVEGSTDIKMNKYLYLADETKATVELASRLRENMPNSERDNVKDIVDVYLKWICDNIYYPEDIQSLKGKYCNLMISDTTLSNRIGVCADIGDLLSTMLRSQGIETRMVGGLQSALLPTSNEVNNNTKYERLRDISHSQVELKYKDKWYLLDPTLYPPSAKPHEQLKLTDGNTVTAFLGTIEFKAIPIVPLFVYYPDYEGDIAPGFSVSGVQSTRPSDIFQLLK